MENVPPPRGNPQIGERHIWAQRISAISDVDEGISGRLQPNGSFDISAFPSGTYDVWVGQGFPMATRIGHATVQADDRDIHNLAIELHSPQTLRVSVRIEGSEAGKAPRVPISLEPVDYLGDIYPPTPKDDGTVEFDDLGLGPYRVDGQPSVRGQVYLKLLRYGSVESHDGTFHSTLTAFLSNWNSALAALGSRGPFQVHRLWPHHRKSF